MIGDAGLKFICDRDTSNVTSLDLSKYLNIKAATAYLKMVLSTSAKPSGANLLIYGYVNEVSMRW